MSGCKRTLEDYKALAESRGFKYIFDYIPKSAHTRNKG